MSVNKPRIAIGITALAGLTALGGVGLVTNHDSSDFRGMDSARLHITDVVTTTKPRTSSSESSAPSPTSGDPAAKLWGLLPPGYDQNNCSVPTDGGVADSVVTLDCDQAPNGPATATFALFPSQKLLDSRFNGFVGEDELQQCPGGNASPGTWNYQNTPDEVAGKIACGTYKGTPDLVWTQNADLLLGNFEGPSLQKLYDFWSNPGGTARGAALG